MRSAAFRGSFAGSRKERPLKIWRRCCRHQRRQAVGRLSEMSRSYASKGRSPCASLLSPPASYPGSSGSAQDRSLYVRFLHFWQFTGNFVTLLCLRDVDGRCNPELRPPRQPTNECGRKGAMPKGRAKSSKRRSTTDRRLSNGVHGSPRCSTAFSSDLTSNLVTGSAMAGSP